MSLISISCKELENKDNEKKNGTGITEREHLFLNTHSNLVRDLVFIYRNIH